MITENLSTLKIHKLTQAQYDRERTAGNIDESALYLTTDIGSTSNKVFTLNAEDWYDEEGTLMWMDASLGNSFTNGTLVVSPEPSSLDSYNEYIKCGVRCIHSGDGAITFAANAQPTINLVVNVTSFA